jgi:hypothetical protein
VVAPTLHRLGLAFRIEWFLRGIPVLLLLVACATADAVRPFPLDRSYTERYADPGTVDSVCYTPGGAHDDGSRQAWNDSYCGCVDFKSKTVWIARHINCDLERTRLHEACHIATGPSKKARALCHKEFPPPAVFRDIPR